MRWTVSEARSRFSEVLREAGEQPQLITNRDRVTAVIVGGETYREFCQWQQQRRATLFDSFEEVRLLCQDEAYEFDLPERTDRSNIFAEVLDDLVDGHQCPE